MAHICFPWRQISIFGERGNNFQKTFFLHFACLFVTLVWNFFQGTPFLIWNSRRREVWFVYTLLFLAVQNSSLGDLVTESLTQGTLLIDIQRATQETCDLWYIWSEWWGDMTWPAKRQWHRQRQRQIQWKRQRHLEKTIKEQLLRH